MTDPCILPDCEICAPAAEAWEIEQRAMLAALWEAAAIRADQPPTGRPLSDMELRAIDQAETRAEDMAAERRGDYLSDRDRDRMADAAADRYERWMEGA